MRFFRHLCVSAICALSLSWSAVITAQPRPSVQIDVPSHGLVGERVDEARVHFSNMAAMGDPGFGPFVDLVIDSAGADGGASPDGLVLKGATLLGQSVGMITLEFPDEGSGTGCVDHPLARDTMLAPQRVCGPSGWSLVVVELPFASFVVGQPEATIDLDLEISGLADTTDLKLHARAGFRFGATPLDDPCCDPSLIEPGSSDSTTWPVARITPTVMQVRVRYLGPEDERAVGPNFPFTYVVEADIAQGQVIDDLTFDVTLPPHMAYLDVTSPGVTTLIEPPVGRAPGSNEAILRVLVPQVVGAQGPDAMWTFEAFVAPEDAALSATLTPATGDDRLEPLHVNAQGQWVPIDPRDPSALHQVGASSPDHELSEEAISVQHSWVIVIDKGAAGVTPGDVIAHTCDIQISDVFAFTDLMLDATISDGQRLLAGDTPTLEFTRAGFETTGLIGPPRLTITPRYSPLAMNPDGTTALRVDLSAETLARGQGADWLGGCVSSMPGMLAARCATQNVGPTTARVTWRTEVLDAFSDDFPSSDASVDAGDLLRVDVEIAGDLLDTRTFAATGFDERDDSGSLIDVTTGEFDLQIVAINGQLPASSALEVRPGDAVTYELVHTLPTSDVEGLHFEAYFPLPIFDVTEIDVMAQLTPGVTLPAPGEVALAPQDTLTATLGVAPTVQIDPQSNALILSYPDFDDVNNRQTKSAIRVTVTATDEPFADALVLSTLARSTHGSTNASGFVRDRVRAITFRQPILRLTKGVIETTPPTPGLDFDPTRPVTSSGLMAIPNDGVAGAVDAGDTIRFSVVIENMGGAQAWDVWLRDIRAAGLVTPPGGLNLEIRRGDGTALTATPQGPQFSEEDLFGDGLLLDDPTIGVCQSYTATAGTNIVTVSYDLMVADIAAIPAALLANQAELLSYHNTPNAPETNHVSDPRDHAISVISTVAVPGLEHVLMSTSEGYTTASDLTIGESFVGRVRVDVPEGVMPAASVEITLPPTMELVAVDRVTRSPALVVTAPGGWASVEATSPTASGWTAPLGTLTNPDRVDAVREVIEIDYTARVLDVAGSTGGQRAMPEARIIWSGGQIAASIDLALVEPMLVVTKAATPINPDAGDVVTYTLAIEHAAGSTAPARRVSLVDEIPVGLSLVPGSLRAVSGPMPSALGALGARVDASWVTLDLGQRAEIAYDVMMPTQLQAATSFVERADLDWESLDSGDSSRGGDANAAHTLTSRAPTMTRRVSSTSLDETTSAAFSASDPDLALGEEATIELEITLPEGLTPNVSIEFEAPNNSNTGFTEVLAARLVSFGTNLSTPRALQATIDDRDQDGRPDRARLDLGDVLNVSDNVRNAADRVVLEVDVRALSVNFEGTSLRHRAWTRWTGGQVQGSTRLDVVRPRIQLSKVMTGPVGDVANVTLRAINVGSGPAYAFALEDRFDATSWDLSALIPVSVTPGLGLDLPSFDGSTPLRLTSLNPGTPLAPGAEVEAIFRVPITPAARAAGAVDNTLTASGVASLPPASLHAALESPVTTTSTLFLGRPSLHKRAEIAVNVDGAGEVAPGDTLRYVLEVPNDGPGPLTDLVLEDPTIDGFSLDPASIRTSPGASIEPWANGVRVRFANVAGWTTSWVSFEGTVEATLAERLSNQATMRWREHASPVLSDDLSTPEPQDPVVLDVPVADRPTLTIPDEVRGDEDGLLPLPIAAQLVDTDGSELLDVHVLDMPLGATLSAGTRDGGRVVLTPAQLPGLTYSPLPHTSGTSALRVVARATEQRNLHVVEREATVQVMLDPVVDPPTLQVAPLAAREQIPSPLPITAQLVDVDGSESLTLFITGAPDGTVFSIGTSSPEGWSVPGEALAGLTMTPPPGGGFLLTVTARSEELATGERAEVSASIDVSIEDGRLTQRTSPNLLILRDTDTSAGSTALLVQDLVAANMTVTPSVLDVTAWKGKRPTLDGFDVVLLMAGTASIEGIDPRGQASLERWVRAGGALVVHEPLGRLADEGRLESMRDLVLFDGDATTRDALPWQAAVGQSAHPLALALDLPRSLSGEMGEVTLHPFDIAPAELVAVASDGTPVVATREVGSGRVVHLNTLGNASTGTDTWAGASARQAVVASLAWALPDVDDDTIPGWQDNCALLPNADQLDTDQDGVGDVCDPCPTLYERVQSDTDQDGLGDACDPCPGFASNDADGDGVCDGFASCGLPAVANDVDQDGIPDTCGARSDNCLGVKNTAQRDSDGDGAGDACDPCPDDAPDDSDGDGTCDAWDRCDDFDDAADADGDGIPDGCDEVALDRAHFMSEGVWVEDAAQDLTLGAGITSSGVDLLGLGLWHDARLDRLVVRVDVDGIAGDIDGDGNPGGTSAALAASGGADLPNFGQEETLIVLLDLDDDGAGDVVIGTPYGTGWDEARVSAFTPGFPATLAPLGFGDTLLDHRMVRSPAPSSSSPDVDFVISNASTLFGDAGPDEFFGVRVWSSAGRSALIGSDQIPDVGDGFTRIRRGDLVRQDRAPALVRGGTFGWFGNLFGGAPTWNFLPLGVRRDGAIAVAPPLAPGTPALTAPVSFDEGVWPSAFKAFPNGDNFDLNADPVEVYSQLFHTEQGVVVRETMRAQSPEVDARGTALNNIDMQSFRVVTLACSHRVFARQHELMGEVLGPRFIGMTNGGVFAYGHTRAPVIVHHLSFYQFDALGELDAIHEYCPEDYLAGYDQVVGIAPSFTHYAFLSDHDYVDARASVELTPNGGVLLEQGTWVLNASYWTWANRFATHVTYSFEPGPDCPAQGAPP